MPKNIVVFSDGTGNRRFEDRDTNVAKLYGFMEVDSDDQVAFYDSGVGTNYLKITGSTSGLSLSKNIMECYDFIAHRYKPGDAISCSGSAEGHSPSGVWAGCWASAAFCKKNTWTR